MQHLQGRGDGQGIAEIDGLLLGLMAQRPEISQ
jgi:hypothetical protein